jgi:general stress protein 26
MSAPNASNNVAELANKIGSVRFAMFTTVDQHGHLVSHPMTRQETDEHGALWFFTSTHSNLWEHIAQAPEVNVSFAQPEDSLFVSVSGRAERVVERERIKSMWNPVVSSWFPHGPDDPHVVLVRVWPHAAEYWDSNESKMVRLFQMAKAAITGTAPEVDPSEHGTIRL